MVAAAAGPTPLLMFSICIALVPSGRIGALKAANPGLAGAPLLSVKPTAGAAAFSSCCCDPGAIAVACFVGCCQSDHPGVGAGGRPPASRTVSPFLTVARLPSFPALLLAFVGMPPALVTVVVVVVVAAAVRVNSGLCVCGWSVGALSNRFWT